MRVPASAREPFRPCGPRGDRFRDLELRPLAGWRRWFLGWPSGFSKSTRVDGEVRGQLIGYHNKFAERPPKAAVGSIHKGGVGILVDRGSATFRKFEIVSAEAAK